MTVGEDEGRGVGLLVGAGEGITVGVEEGRGVGTEVGAGVGLWV